MEQTKKFLSVDQVAEKLGVSRSMVLKMVKRGDFPTGIKLGQCRRWSETQIDAWLDELETQAIYA